MGSNEFRSLTLTHNEGVPLLGYFTNGPEDNRFITKHNLDQSILKDFSTPFTHKSLKIYVLACRNGMVLLYAASFFGLIVAWNPIKKITKVIPVPNFWCRDKFDNCTILCLRNHCGPCTDCGNSDNFWVVWVTTDTNLAKAQRYSSQLGGLHSN